MAKAAGAVILTVPASPPVTKPPVRFPKPSAEGPFSQARDVFPLHATGNLGPSVEVSTAPVVAFFVVTLRNCGPSLWAS